MSNKTTKAIVEFESACHAFTNQGCYAFTIQVDSADVVRVFDKVAGHFTTVHALNEYSQEQMVKHANKLRRS